MILPALDELYPNLIDEELKYKEEEEEKEEENEKREDIKQKINKDENVVKKKEFIEFIDSGCEGKIYM